MFSKALRLTVCIFILSLVLSGGCSAVGEITTPVSSTPYQIPVSLAYPDESPPKLVLVSGLPGMLRLIGYSGHDFVTGTIDVGDRERAPVMETGSSRVSLTQPATTDLADIQGLTNLWKLRVSDNKSFQLEIHNGRAEGHWNFSGLPIINLFAELGTAKNAFTFDQPNPDVMQKCELHCGTGEVVVEGILDAACREIVITAGGGPLTLRFGEKDLREDCQVTIQTGTGTINLTVSPDTPVRISVSGTGRVAAGEGIIKSEKAGNNDVYETPAYREGHSKAIDIIISGSSGTIHLNPPLS